MFIIVNDIFLYSFTHFHMMLHRSERGDQTVKKTNQSNQSHVLRKFPLKPQQKCLSRRVAVKTFLSKGKGEKRLTYPKLHNNWVENQCQQVLQSDESNFENFSSNHRQYARQSKVNIDRNYKKAVIFGHTKY